MTTHPGTTEPERGRRAIAALLTAAVMLSVVWYAATASIAIGTVLGARSGALLATPRLEAADRLDQLNDDRVRTAIAAMPLDQRLVNIGMAREAKRQGNGRTASWLAVLARLGWRDTASVQNMLYAAALTTDLPRILDLGDALLRRRQLTDQMIPVLSTVEGDAALRAIFVQRLAERPSWRGLYLTTTGHLRTRDQLIARFETIRLLQRRGARLDQAEVVPSITALDGADLSQYGFALWQSIRPNATRPLDDTGFVLASRSYATGHDPVPYQWQMMTGQGFSADASRDGDQASLTIDWDGRGVPVFAQQRTSAGPGSYTLAVAVAPEDVGDLSAIDFRLVCDDGAVGFRQILADPTRYVTTGPVRCSFPLFQIAGEIQAGASTHQLSFDRITMQPLGRPSGPIGR